MNWNSSILWGIVGLMGGFIFSFVFFLLGKRKRKISYSIKTTPIIEDKASKIPGLSITYNDEEINNLYSSYIEIINIGNESLEPNDFLDLHKLSLKTDGQFLVNHHEIEIQINSPNQYVEITPIFQSSNIITIDFNCLDPKNRFYITIFHTGHIILSGKIKNGKIIDYNDPKEIMITNLISYLIPGVIILILILLLYIN